MCEEMKQLRERHRMFCVLVAVQENEHYNILSVVLYGCGTWYVTVKEEHRLSVLENTVLRETFGSKGKEHEADENCIMRSCMIGTAHHVWFG
jgi:hypothetical protein